MNPPSTARERLRGSRAVSIGWLLLFAAIAAWVFHRLGGFDLWATIALPDGTTERVVNTFAGVDHPFHATRAELLRRSLANGELLRWISAHQGGYPVEFYPLGAPAFELLIWAMTLGTLPVIAAHKVAVIAIFLLPALGFFLLAREDRLPLGFGLLALVFHICVRGFWWSGGYWELVDWGLVSSSLAMATLVAFMPIVYHAVRARSVRWGGVAAVIAAFAVYTNVRSLLPMTAIALGLLASLAWEPDRRDQIRGRLLVAVGVVAVTGLLAAPLLIALARFNDLYYFVVYERYDSFREYWDASIVAVSRPVFWLSIVGLVGVFLLKELRAGRFVAFTLIAHVAITLLLSGLLPGPTIEQLEATRLMPLQRALMLYLAAMGVYLVLHGIARAVKQSDALLVNVGLLAAIGATLMLYVGWDNSPVPESDRALYPVTTSGSAVFAEQQRAVELADVEAAPGTAVLVLGSVLSWHDQFWSIDWSKRPFYFNDWLWYWQRDLDGVYNPETEHVYPDPATTLTTEFLANQGIGAVVVTGPASSAARVSPDLELIDEGSTYSVYRVRNPTPIITAEGTEISEIAVGNQAYTATVSEPSTTFEVRRNWFPRWTATVDGQPANISKDDDGFMTVTASTPGTNVVVTYGTDAWDWLGRVMLVVGIASAAIAIVQPRRVERVLKLHATG